LADSGWVIDGLPVDGGWTNGCGCESFNKAPVSTVDNVVVTGAPGGVTSVQNGQSLWALILNDGMPQADFRIDRYTDGAAAPTDSPMTIERATGIVTFHDPVMLSEDPVEPLEAATKNYVDTHAAGLTDAPNDGTLYGRKSLAWSHLTHADIADWAAAIAAAGYIGDAPSDTTTYARNNAAWVHLTHTDITDWTSALAPYVTDAPNDGTAYARKSAAWAHLTHTDITDWTATLAPYALTTAVPVGSNAAPLMDGTAAAGTSLAFARGDHVHPTDTSRAAVTALPPASTTTPLPNGVAAVGTSAAYARADHVHPAPAPDSYAHENRIINGDMRIDQRNNGVGGQAAGYTCDRWKYNASLAAKFNWQRVSNLPAPGFPYALGCASQSAYTPLVGDTFYLFQPIEADMISDFQWGTANAQAVTLSFLAQSSLTGTFSGVVGNAVRSYPFTYSLPTANTWTKIAVTIPGDTGATWTLSGNAMGVSVNFDLGSGATYRGPAGAWGAGNWVGANGAVNVVAVSGAAFYVTGVKLEIGNAATPFNRQSLAKSMADCQRYFQVIAANMIAGYGAAGVQITVGGTIPVTMRATPTLVLTPATNIVNCSAQAGAALSPNAFYARMNSTVTGGALWQSDFQFSAEL
jgi:hypothetical protein